MTYEFVYSGGEIMKSEDIRRGGPAPTPPKVEKKAIVLPAKITVPVPQPRITTPSARLVVAKRPWPGDWVFYSNWAYGRGYISDSSGRDALIAWTETATPEEITYQKKRCGSYGWLTGYAAGYAAVNVLWKFIFGNPRE